MIEMERSSRGWWCFPRRSAPRSCCQRRVRRRRAAVERQTLAPHWTMQQQAPARSVRRPHRAQTARWPEESLSSAAAATNGDLPSRQRMPNRPLPHWPRRRRLRIPHHRRRLCHRPPHRRHLLLLLPVSSRSSGVLATTWATKTSAVYVMATLLRPTSHGTGSPPLHRSRLSFS